MFCGISRSENHIQQISPSGLNTFKLNILLNLLDLDTINYLIKHQRHTLDALNSLIQLSFGLWSCCTKFSIRHLRLILMWKNVGIDKSLMLKISLSHMTRNKKHSPQLPFLRIYVIYGKPVGTGHLIIYHSGPSIFLIMIGYCNTYAMVALNFAQIVCKSYHILHTNYSIY